MQRSYNVLFLCTGNSARSIMAEAILNHKGRANFTTHSAGSHPAGIVRQEAMRELESAHISIANLRSKRNSLLRCAKSATLRILLLPAHV